MLAKKDILILRTLIREEIESLRTDMTTVKTDITAIKSDIIAIKSEVVSHSKQLKLHNTRLNRVIKDVSWISKGFDQEIVENRQRIEKLEERCGVGFSSPRE